MSNENSFSKALHRSHELAMSLLNSHFQLLSTNCARSQQSHNSFADELFLLLGRIDFVKQRDYITLLLIQDITEDQASQEIIDTVNIAGVCFHRILRYTGRNAVCPSSLSGIDVSLKDELKQIDELLCSFHGYWVGSPRQSIALDDITSFSIHMRSKCTHLPIVVANTVDAG